MLDTCESNGKAAFSRSKCGGLATLPFHPSFNYEFGKTYYGHSYHKLSRTVTPLNAFLAKALFLTTLERIPTLSPF